MNPQPSSLPDVPTTASYGDQNNINGTNCPDSPAWKVQPAIILLISVLGITFNLFVLMVFCLHKKACTVAEIYLSNLAAADLVLVSCLPFWAVNVYNGFSWPFGQFMCKVVNMGMKMNACASIYFIVLIGIDRYVALVHPMSHGRMRRTKCAKLGCGLMWGLGFLMSVPTFIFRKVNVDGNHECYLNYPNQTVRNLCDAMLIVLGFIIPILLISFCTIKIIQALKIHIEMSNAEKTEQKATILMLAVLIAFIICWVPFHVVTALLVLLQAGVLKGCQLATTLLICIQIFNYLAISNSVLNPILYVIVGKNFREKVHGLFKQQWCNNRRATFHSVHTNREPTMDTLM